MGQSSRSLSRYSAGEMMVEIYGREIETVAVVDDETRSRESLLMCVDDSPVSSFSVLGPLPQMTTTYQLIASRAQGCICDHDLQKQGDYAQFSGAALAAWNNRHDLPSILCTRYLDSQMPSIRGYLKDIPVLCKPDQLEHPEEIMDAFRLCVAELNGSFVPERRSWRTQVVVEQLDTGDRTISVSLPAWQVDDWVRVRIDDVPLHLRGDLKIGFWTYVRANIGESRPEFLYIDWSTE